ncbi:MAG: restriction endonuclease subunit S [Candidatus Electrothrix aestuarii]|uniref:Restriction endonuclease subunit S n=1 Tax=Candidatus Electrothrix aestuarii TaxID=3062594 RepID=A0AAU8LSS3_9BACT|nr:restriction endonuclease subunit S [Candidatus Electrothrix aestuarii]
MGGEWQEVQLQDIVTILGDGLHGTPKYDEDGEYYFINGNNLEEGRIVFRDKTKRVAHDQFVKYKKKLNDRTILVSINGTIGNVAYYNGEKIILGKSACYFNLVDGVEKGFVRYVLSGSIFQNYLHQYSTGTTIKNVSLKDMREFSFQLPSVNEQKAIAHALGTLDDQIELNRQMNETLEAMAQTLFKSWFVDFDPVIDNAQASGKEIPEELRERAEARAALGDKRKPLPEDIRSLFPDEFIYNDEMGWIPKGWEVAPLSKITTELRRGISPKYIEKGGVRVVNQRCIRNHEIDYTLTRLNDETKRKVDGRLLEKGDLLINSTGVGTLGRMAQVHTLSEPTVVDSHVTVARANKNKYLPYTFARMMLSLEPYVEEMGEGTTGQTELSRKNLAQLQVIVPPVKTQENAEKYFYELYHKASLNIKNSSTLSLARDTLLPKLLSGELRIPDAEKMVEEVV